MWVVFLILFATIVLFLLDRFPLEIVGFISLLSLVLVGKLTPAEAAEGFSNSVVILLGGLFVVGGALMSTGVAQAVADLLERWSDGGLRRLQRMVVLSSSSLSTVMSATGTTALLIPAVMGAAQNLRASPSRLMIPLAFGSSIGGMLTLIGGTPNLIANEALLSAGHEGFGFFSFTPIGGCVLIFFLLSLTWGGDRLLRDRVEPLAAPPVVTVDELLAEYDVLDNLVELRLPPEGRWRPQTLGELHLRSERHIDVLAVREAGTGQMAPPTVETLLKPAAVLYARAQPEHLDEFCRETGSRYSPFQPGGGEVADGRGLAEVILPPRSKLEGKSLAQVGFYRRYGVRVMKIRRAGRPLQGDVADVELRFGDCLLVEGPWERLLSLKREQFDFVVIGIPQELSRGGGFSYKAKVALAITGVMVVLMATETVSPMIASLLAALALILTKCVSLEDAYGSISWGTLFLVATMLPLSTALEKTGGSAYLTQNLLSLTASHGPYFTLVGVYLLSTTLGQLMSNTATAILLAPVALEAATQLGVTPEAFLMAMALGGSASFLTPLATPSNVLVTEPGGYKFTDFLRAGLPLHLATSVICLIGIPLLYPFHAR